ncbi:agmatine deiminase family protein [Crenothrix polyspora]|uniref:Putative agmatine deiminase n=1 Tax=Crenothrix polyspora TaxID=360316 RepID=A0A1R4HB03_9GAMM|nr:agmatine deiminase family protein [Crenothrix polyspora]SJM93442.1 putative agmatine deiminase [Crenothrix polyspora]
MITRRKFVQTSLLLSGGLLIRPTSAATSLTSASTANDWFMPDESEPHTRTWMAFGASQAIWGKKLLPEVQRNLALIARTIAQFEPVSMLVRKSDYALARKLVGASVTLVIAPMDDLWMRDTGAVFVVTEKGDKAAIKFNFNGWGNKQEHTQDMHIASFVATQAATKILSTKLVLEGGGIEVDGQGTAIITESCVLNANRNPGISKVSCEAELKRLLGLEKIIWLPGIKGKDITDGHTDFYARFAKPGVVVAGYDADPQSFDHAVTKKHLNILKTATDANGKRLHVVVIEGPATIRPTYESNDFAAGYINFYVCNGAVIAPEFGDKKADNAAKTKLQTLFPNRKIVQLNIDGIAAGGGGIHCTTQQEPKI